MSLEDESIPETTFTVHHETDAELWRSVSDGLGAFNASAAQLDKVRPLACAARLPTGEIVGGVVGRTWGECCEMLQLWIDEPYRKRGVGRQLVSHFHKHAEARGCRTFYLDTFSFQAPDFYRRFGYEVRLQLRGYADGVVKYFMIREVNPTPDKAAGGET